MNQNELKAIAHELTFWKGFVNDPRFLNKWLSPTEKTPDLQEEVYNFLVTKSNSRVLDIGSGVVSILRGTVLQEHLVATDPLSDLYRVIFDYKKFNLEPPLAISGENLLFRGEFDIAHISNALDHCQVPFEVFARMEAAIKPGGFIIIQGFTNEGESEKYSGFHQWNVDLDDHGWLFINGQPLAQTKTFFKKKKLSSGKEWAVWIREKR